jgi:polyisoprenoid-binding protein YceI
MRKLAVVALALVVLIVGGPWVYINVIREDAPEELSLTETTDVPVETTIVLEPIDVEGTWRVGAGSLAGYRVDEILFGQDVTAVGRTEAITGEFVIEGESVVEAQFSVDLTQVTSDSSRRDSQFANRIMDVLNFPSADFVLESPIDLPPSALMGEEFTITTSGTLTLRGRSGPVDMLLTARLNGSTIEVSASTEIVFADWGIPDPSLPGVTTEDFGVLEALLKMEKS